MGRKSQDQRRIELRLRAIEDEIAEMSLRRDMLTCEQEELRTALKVLSRLHGSSETENQQATSDDEDDADGELADGQDMTIGAMALELLREAGPAGMTSPEILAAIQKRWRPSLVRTSLSPPLSRLKDREKIELVGEQWRLVTANGPPERSGEPEIGGGSAPVTPASSRATPHGHGTG
jgi:hypothetical protein